MSKFVLWGTYCENALEKRTPFRTEHLDRLGKLKKKGVLITLGPTEGSQYVFGVFEADSIQLINKLIEEDVYWKNGIWTSYEIFSWTQAF